jgi:hypothetical protein
MVSGLHYLDAKQLISLRQPFQTVEQIGFFLAISFDEIEKERKENFLLDFFVFSFCNWVRCYAPPPVIGGGWESESPACLQYGTRIRDWVPLFGRVLVNAQIAAGLSLTSRLGHLWYVVTGTST